ncbi:uncharacterized protein E0L32_006718 [Thyridium curvatum]|uniref:Uncharacterized protein n=1 Tax=Thyridium curvatum TaxID=1093900 RepID=A0A507B7U5_9PEZI|nr:uncharacterized protein E0L32_006718 [Thyridium curvatum]TPX12838.1 hypothetical protein E0L32_006718 [Thyridium curvatum]
MADQSTVQDNLPPPPPYVAESQQHGDDASTAPPPAYDHVETPADPVHGDEKRRQHEAIAAPRSHGPALSASSSSPPPPPPPAEASSSSSSRGGSSSSNPFNLIRSAKEAYEARQANKKVDYYEKMYGFVPKNVMTEAEWKRARKEAPRERKPFESYVKKQYFGSWD